MHAASTTRRRLVTARSGLLVAAAVLLLLGMAVAALLALDAFRSDAASGRIAISGLSTRLALEPIEITQLAAGEGRVTWTTSFEGTPVGDVVSLDLDSGKRTRVARGDIVYHGLGIAAGWIVYALQEERPRLIARKPEGGQTVLSRHLVGSFDADEDRLAWPEQVGEQHRVVVRDMRSGTEWVAATLPRCEGPARCYRIDAVRLSAGGVAFSRGAIGSHPSQIYRRAYDEPRATSIRVPDDPQPELLPSSSGALFHALGRGLLRWDFGWGEPRPVDVPGLDPSSQVVVGYERGQWLIVGTQAGSEILYGQRPGKQIRPLTLPPQTEALAYLVAFAFDDERVYGAWNVRYAGFRQGGHTHGGLSGVVAAGAGREAS